MAEVERNCVPMLGDTTDRRNLSHVGEVFNEDSTSVLICFVCACKKIQHRGFDMFGRKQELGKISYCSNSKLLQSLLHGGGDKDLDVAFQYNLSYDFFKKRKLHEAVSSDKFLGEASEEWCRATWRKEVKEELLCCPEDVRRTPHCCHPDDTICASCYIPICNECVWLLGQGRKIPKALCNDNYISYQHQYIVENCVTWLEATIACPVFTGLITYYIEGSADQRGHLMQETLGKVQRAYAVRGNCFSFLLPWDTVMKKLSRSFARGDFTQWPLDQNTAAQIVRLKMIRGHEALIDQFKELKVRSQVVKEMAKLYIDSQLNDLISRDVVVKLLAQRRSNLRDQFRDHIDLKVDADYPMCDHGTPDGSIPALLRSTISEAAEKNVADTGFDNKQATGHDSATSPAQSLSDLRPSTVVAEATTQGAFADEVQSIRYFSESRGFFFGIEILSDNI